MSACWTALSLWATGVLGHEQAIAGFGDPTVIFIATLSVVSEALEASGVTTWAGQELVARAGESRTRLLVLTIGLVAFLTALISVNGAVAALVAAILVVRNLVHSSYGRALIAIREDEIAAAAIGIDTFRYKVIGFTAGCAFAGVAGGLYANLYTFLHPSTFDFLKSFDVLMIVVLGGLGNLTGTLVASFAWVFLLEGMRVALPPEYIEFRWVLIPLLLIVTMLVRPRGLFGIREFPLLRSKVYR